MRILKIILVFFVIYFIRRFIQMYRVMKQIQDQQLAQAKENQAQAAAPKTSHEKIVDAEYKVID